MKARDVLIDVLAPVSFYAEEPGTKGDMTARLEAHLLAQTPEGEGVYIAPDGTLMRVTAEIDSRQGDRILRNDDSDLMFDPDESYPDDDWLYRLVRGGDR